MLPASIVPSVRFFCFVFTSFAHRPRCLSWPALSLFLSLAVVDVYDSFTLSACLFFRPFVPLCKVLCLTSGLLLLCFSSLGVVCFAFLSYLLFPPEHNRTCVASQVLFEYIGFAAARSPLVERLGDSRSPDRLLSFWFSYSFSYATQALWQIALPLGVDLIFFASLLLCSVSLMAHGLATLTVFPHSSLSTHTCTPILSSQSSFAFFHRFPGVSSTRLRLMCEEVLSPLSQPLLPSLLVSRMSRMVLSRSLSPLPPPSPTQPVLRFVRFFRFPGFFSTTTARSVINGSGPHHYRSGVSAPLTTRGLSRVTRTFACCLLRRPSLIACSQSSLLLCRRLRHRSRILRGRRR